MLRSSRSQRAALAAAWLAGTLACRATPALRRLTFEEPAMGTTFHVVLHARDAARAERAAAAAFARIAELEAALTDWDEASELSRLSARSAGGPSEPVVVSEDLFRVLERARAVSEASGGAFDVTVGPCVRLWRRSARQGELPRFERLAAARAALDWRAVQLDPPARSVALGLADMRLDLGGIAKGYALDEALAVLRAHGLPVALVEGGGDLAAGDPPPGERGWHVAVVANEDERDAPGARLVLANAGCATSGDLYRQVAIDGAVYGHVIDPRTGLGSTRRAAATVVGESAMDADAWASALCVLGAEGMELIEARAALEARVVERAAGNAPARTCESSGLARMMAAPPTPRPEPRTR